MKNTVDMGVYYQTPNGLIKTVCRATSPHWDKYIVYVQVAKGGYASEPLLLKEDEFKSLIGM